jgi:hypothetical protein
MLRLGPLILRNVLRNRRRSILTLASTAVSLALLALLAAMYQGFFYDEPASPSEARRLICRHRVSLTQSLPASHFAHIKAIPGVEQVSAWTWFQGVYIDEKHFFARFAVDPDVIFDIRKDWEMPPGQLADFKRGRTATASSSSATSTPSRSNSPASASSLTRRTPKSWCFIASISPNCCQPLPNRAIRWGRT